jgi:hypothetical protein
VVLPNDAPGAQEGARAPQPPYERYRFTATDTSWSVGTGPEIDGPVLAILLVLAGRPAGLPHLTGDGAATLVARVGFAWSCEPKEP